MFGTRKRKLTAILGAVFALAIAGGAYAYWSGAGSGTGTGTVNSGTTVTLHGTVAPGLAPGVTEAVAFTADNPGTAGVFVSTVHAVVSFDAGHSSCLPADFPIADTTESFEVPAGASGAALPTAGSIKMNDTAISQDACKGATVNLTLTSN